MSLINNAASFISMTIDENEFRKPIDWMRIIFPSDLRISMDAWRTENVDPSMSISLLEFISLITHKNTSISDGKKLDKLLTNPLLKLCNEELERDSESIMEHLKLRSEKQLTVNKLKI
ncbi:MAG: hypothetical protein Sylvanvirus7_21 [Sylvanvirus sp.]|uniref:Uncharacterized protein n=1 Tax=Sylvanvirus sp. TaxID=2487774 RepID=A0A3G5AKF4_9VIRU|nr:MAG: hypothetical protein Sylvanvirus7_21 [Sylvanvirus sp.]